MSTKHSLKDIAERLGISEHDILRDIQEGKLSAKLVDEHFIVTRSDLESYVKSHQRTEELFGKRRTGVGPAANAEIRFNG